MLSKKSILKISLVLIISSCLILNHHKHKVVKKKYMNYVNQQFDKDLKLKQFNSEKQFIKTLQNKQKDIELKIKEEQEKEKLEKKKQKQEGNQWIPVKCSFYTNDTLDCGKTDGISASGKNLNRGGNYCAAPKGINFGTKLYIQDLGNYTVEDRGGAIVWKDGIMNLDIFIPNTSQEYLNKLGVKYTKAKIIK